MSLRVAKTQSFLKKTCIFDRQAPARDKIRRHGYVHHVRTAVPSGLHLPLLCACKHGDIHHILLNPLNRSRRQVQDCCAHLWACYLQCCIRLHPYLGLCVPLLCRNRCQWRLGNANSHLDWHPLQRCLSLHGLALICAIALDPDPSRDEARRRHTQQQGLGPWCGLRPHDCLRLLRRACRLRRLDPTSAGCAGPSPWSSSCTSSISSPADLQWPRTLRLIYLSPEASALHRCGQ